MSRNSGSSLAMFMVGAAVGAAVAALYTPVTGPALRRRLSDAASGGLDMAYDGFEQAVEQADDFIKDTTASARNAVNQAGEAFQQARKEATNAAG